MTNRVFAVGSGSGGVGKSTLALALALGAATMGRRTILLDASGVGRSCDLMLGLESAIVLDLTDVLSGEASLKQALYRVPAQENLSFCCASLLTDVPLCEFAGVLLALRSMCDVLVIDLPTGSFALESGVLGEDDVRVLLVRPDDASLRSAERMLAQAEQEKAQLHVVLGHVKRELVKKGSQYTEEAAMQILDRPIAGCIPEDDGMASQVGKGRARFSFTGAARAQLDRIVKTLLNESGFSN